MKITRVIALAVIVASSGVAMSHAQSLRNADQPAEFPPSSYKGTQYIDSRGCVYVRAGISGNVSWIPRVTRSRNQICGQTPSRGTSVAAAAPRANAPAAPVQITLDAPVQPAATPKPVTRVVAKPQVRRPVATPQRIAVARPARVRTPVAVAEVKPVVIRPAPVPARRKVVTIQRQTARAASACAGSRSGSQNYNGSAANGLAVRCGPQTQSHYNSNAAQPARSVAAPSYAAAAPRVITRSRLQIAPQVARVATTEPRIDGGTRVIPKHVLANRQNTQNVQIPDGYRAVWEDDRLNPNRAEQSRAGQARTELVWTNTVPRRLIDTGNGRDVTASTPLVYPYVDVARQSRELGTVSIVRRDGQVLKRVQRNNYGSANVRQPVVSSRSASAAQQAAPKATAARTIQVGTFADQNGAQAVAKRVQRLGFPVGIGKFTRGGRTYRMVLAGPFGSDAGQALSKLRAAGYRNATLR